MKDIHIAQFDLFCLGKTIQPTADNESHIAEMMRKGHGKRWTVRIEDADRTIGSLTKRLQRLNERREEILVRLEGATQLQYSFLTLNLWRTDRKREGLYEVERACAVISHALECNKPVAVENRWGQFHDATHEERGALIRTLPEVSNVWISVYESRELRDDHCRSRYYTSR